MKLRVPGNKRFPDFQDAPIPTFVYQNGEKLTRVVAVDTEAGICWRHKLNEQGMLLVDPSTQEVVLEEIHGTFECVSG
jgi:hypothetical protein